MSTKVELMDGKYTLEHNNGVGLRCLRYGEYWRDLVGDSMVLALVSEVEELREKVAKTDPTDDGRAEFEAWVSNTFECSWCAFDQMNKMDGTTTYVYDVRHKSIAGQVTDEKCSVQMLWECWKTSRCVE